MQMTTRRSRRFDREETLHQLAWGGDSPGWRLATGGRAVEAREALKQLQTGKYGICVDCGKRIPAGRLRAKPEATRCVACQESSEQS